MARAQKDTSGKDLGRLWQRTDEFLVKRCQAGDAHAWEVLVRRYQRLVYHFPAQVSLDPEDADEVFQETFMALYRQLDRIEHKEDLSYWLARVAQRQTWRALHRARNRLKESFPENYDVEDPDLIPEQQVELKVQQSLVRRALHAMDAKCRMLLTELFFRADDTDYRNIAKQMGIAVGSIGPTRNRCLLKFKKMLAKLGLTEKNVSRGS